MTILLYIVVINNNNKNKKKYLFVSRIITYTSVLFCFFTTTIRIHYIFELTYGWNHNY